MGKLKKRSTIIIISVVTVIVLTAVIALCVLFCPRKLSRIVDIEGIESIEILEFNKVVKVLSADEISDFINLVKKSKYRNSYFKYKAMNTQVFMIYYKDKSIYLMEYRASIIDNAENVDYRNIRVSLSEFYDAFAP